MRRRQVVVEDEYASDAALDPVDFAWAGPTDAGAPHYYRVQGPGPLIEWDNTQRGANHAPSVWRDPDGDFCLAVLGRHRVQHHSRVVRSSPGAAAMDDIV